MKTKDLLILFSFIFLVIILRFSSFFQSVIDQDETAYLLGADSLLKGANLYTEIWDNKPPVIFWIFALGLFLFGNGVVSIRFISCLVVGITCFFLYKTGKIITKENKIGLFAGLLYSILTLTNGGLAANTEIFFNAFTAASFLIFFKIIYDKQQEINKRKYELLIIGILLGIGIQIKQVVLFEFISILIIIAIHTLYEKQKNFEIKTFITELINWYLWLIIGLIIPTVIIFVYFFLFSDFPAYFEVNFTATLTRVSYEKFSVMSLFYALLMQVKVNSILWLSVVLTPVYIFLERKKNLAQQLPIIDLITWSLMSFLGICAIKSFFSHYFIQLQLPLSLLSSYILINLLRKFNLIKINFLAKSFKVIVLFVLLIPTLLKSIYPAFKDSINYLNSRLILNQPNWGDDPAIIANYIKDKITDNDYIYVLDYQIVIYYLTRAKIPTKYVHISLLTKDRAKVAGINPEEELAKIIAKKPKFIIKTRNGQNQITKSLNNYLQKYYILDQSFMLGNNKDAMIDVYQIKSANLVLLP